MGLDTPLYIGTKACTFPTKEEFEWCLDRIIGQSASSLANKAAVTAAIASISTFERDDRHSTFKQGRTRGLFQPAQVPPLLPRLQTN
jgi:hypothetical protein